MLISLTHKFVFIANLKSASTAIEVALRPMADIALVEARFGKHRPFTWVNATFKWVFDIISIDDFFVFGVMRDPADFVISLYNSHMDPKFRDSPTIYTGSIDFDEFLTRWSKRHPEQFIEQHTRFLTAEGTIAVDYVISYENLLDGLRFVSSKIGAPAITNLPMENASVPGFARKDLTKAHWAWIDSHFHHDHEFMKSWCDRPLRPMARARLPTGVRAKQGRRKGREMVTREQVIYAYRFFFGRDPESEAVIQGWLRLPDWANLREAFLNSEEFHQKFGARLASHIPHEFLLAAPNHVDVNVSEEDFTKLFTHVQRAWEALGVQQPHWSVLTDPRFLPENVEQNLDKFYQSGIQSWEVFARSLARANKEPSRGWAVFELGCGVGRVTAQLARRFGHVIACDVSHAHLQIAENHLHKNSINNVQFLRLEGLEVLEMLQPFDLFYSIIVLQHNPPPLILKILRMIFNKVNRGGCVYFQLPVAAKNYAFRIDDYLRRLDSGHAVMEMHVLPQTHLFRLMDESNLRILDVQRDNLPGPEFHSLTILAEKGE